MSVCYTLGLQPDPLSVKERRGALLYERVRVLCTGHFVVFMAVAGLICGDVENMIGMKVTDPGKRKKSGAGMFAAHVSYTVRRRRDVK